MRGLRSVDSGSLDKHGVVLRASESKVPRRTSLFPTRTAEKLENSPRQQRARIDIGRQELNDKGEPHTSRALVPRMAARLRRSPSLRGHAYVTLARARLDAGRGLRNDWHPAAGTRCSVVPGSKLNENDGRNNVVELNSRRPIGQGFARAVRGALTGFTDALPA